MFVVDEENSNVLFEITEKENFEARPIYGRSSKEVYKNFLSKIEISQNAISTVKIDVQSPSVVKLNTFVNFLSQLIAISFRLQILVIKMRDFILTFQI